MLKKIINFIFTFSLLLSLLFNVTAFAHTATIENSGLSKYKAVRLRPEIYNKANEDLSDIIVKSDKGENIPYFINKSYQTDYKVDYNYVMSLINSYIKDDEFYFDYKIANIPDDDVIATSIEITTDNTNFAKNIKLFGSYDNINWEKVQDDTLYSVDDNVKFEIMFNKPQKFTHYRFKLGNNLEKIAFDTVSLKYNIKTSEKSYFSEEINPKISVEEKDKDTYIYINDLQGLKIDTITLETDNMFKRMATIMELGINNEVYNLSFSGTTYTDTDIKLEGKKIKDDTVTVIIKNNDDKPINIKGIKVKYYADEIVFEDDGSEYYNIDFGRNDTIKAPIYDIMSYKDEILKGDIDKLEIKEIKLGKVKEESKQYDYRLIFNIVIVVVAVLLGVLILMKFKTSV